MLKSPKDYKKREKMGNRLNIFISYRRVDSYDFSGRMHDRLAQEFEDVFFDKEGGIETGAEFPLAIQNGIENADVVLMVIGKDCCKEFKAKEGKRDFVVEEIALAKASGCHIVPILMDGVDFPSCLPERIRFVSAHNAFEFGRNAFSLYMDGLIKNLKMLPKKSSKEQKSNFVKEVMDNLERERLLVLFSQNFTMIDEHLEAIKALVLKKFHQQFYVVSVPSYLEDEKEYFSCIAKDSGLSCQSEKAHDWHRAMRERLSNSHEPLLLLVTDLEEGNEQLDRKLATMLRSLKTEFSHFYTICVGRKALAKLVYGDAHLSPLNNAKELFFPDNNMKLGEEKIAQQFQTMGKYQKQICKLLQKETVGRYSTWSYNDTINQLFWKNLLVKNGNKFVWRGELTKEIAKDVLGCEESLSKF